MLSGELPLSLVEGAGVPLVQLAHTVHVSALTLRTPGRLALLICEGGWGNLDAAALAQEIPAALYDQLKTQILARDRQVVVLEWQRHPTAQLDIMRNHQAGCGLYVVVRKDRVYIHWDPVALYDCLDGPVRLDHDQCLAFLSCSWNYDNATVFRDIQCLPQRAHLRLTPQDVQWLRPSAVAVGSSVELCDGADPVATLCQMVQADIADYCSVRGGRLACELSSGLDSALVASLAAQQLAPGQMVTCGYIPLGADRAVIAARRAEAVARLQAQDYGQPIEQTFPALNEISRQSARRYWPYEAPSLFEKEATARRLAALGVNIVLSGIGGDELCLLTREEKQAEFTSPQPGPVRGQDADFSGLLPARLQRRAATLDIPAWPAGLVPQSAHDVAASLSFAWLRAGIWYAHPLSHASLQSFAHFLPVQWRRDRALSRAALRRFSYSEAYLAQSPKESLSESLDVNLRRYPDLPGYFASSHLLAEGLIDLSQVERACGLLAQGAGERAGLFLTLALALERSLRSIS